VVNRCSAAAPVVPVLLLTASGLMMSASDTAEPVDALLGACARDAIELLGTDARRRVRNCARPVCPMFFEQTHPRRTWCSNYCGDAMRHARQYERTRSP
jgi:predicted RNA-binding Zn ribbon-like protein